MSKSMIEAFASGQFNALSAKDNKERLRFTVAGCKNGCLYDHSGTNYGLFNNDAPDTEWITQKDLELSRITGVKIASILKKSTEFFAEYGDGKASQDAEDTDGSDEPDVNEDEGAEEVDEPAPKKAKKAKKAKVEDTEPAEEAIDVDAVAKACKKAIKKGDTKKAVKLLAKLEGTKAHKKLSKKLGEVQ